jgi:hypothetical protein
MFMNKLFILLSLLLPAIGDAQSYSIDWYKRPWEWSTTCRKGGSDFTSTRCSAFRFQAGLSRVGTQAKLLEFFA